MNNTEQQIQKIIERNTRVEIYKQWETCWTLKIFLTVLTYGYAALFLLLINAENSFSVALVPAGRF